MTTSGTTNFSPSLGELVINAFARCGLRRTELLTQHMQDARMEANLLMADWAASGVNLWAVDQLTTPLVESTATYSVPASTMFLLDVFIRNIDTGVDTLIFPISRSDYAALANKTQEGAPTSYWYDRLLSPTITIWPVPNASDQWTLVYYRARQLQDSDLSNGLGPEIPLRYVDAFSWELAARLASIYAPDKAPALDARAQRAKMTAISADTENVGVRIMPSIAGYFR